MPAHKRQRFLQIDSIILDVCGQTCPNYPKWKVCYFPAILEKEVRNEVDFLHVDNHESMLQIDTMILMGMVKHSQISENSKFAMSLQYLKKKLEMTLILWMHINIKGSNKFISALWLSKLPTRWYYHYWWAWSSILKVLKVTSL